MGKATYGSGTLFKRGRITDPVIAHVTHCSPCFAEIQTLRARNKKAG